MWWFTGFLLIINLKMDEIGDDLEEESLTGTEDDPSEDEDANEEDDFTAEME